MKWLAIIILFPVLIMADEPLKEHCKKVVLKAESVRAVEGSEGWIFNFKELKHLSRQSQFSKQSVKTVIEYKKNLAQEGIELIVVPMPPKAVVYAEFLMGQKSDWNPYKEFHEELKKAGITSIDLLPVFLDLKKQKQVFCKTDSHYSPESVQDISRSITTQVKQDKGTEKFDIEKSQVEFPGDLTRQLDKNFSPEKFPVLIVRKENKLPESDEQSKVVLMGDSNCLIYHSGGDMHVRGAGLFEHLCVDFGMTVDLLAVKGSGVDTVRIDFLRRALNSSYLTKKKLVIWLFSSYELTESSGWKNIPVRR